MIPYGLRDISRSDLWGLVCVSRLDFMAQGLAVSGCERGGEVERYCDTGRAAVRNIALNVPRLSCPILSVKLHGCLWTDTKKLVFNERRSVCRGVPFLSDSCGVVEVF